MARVVEFIKGDVDIKGKEAVVILVYLVPKVEISPLVVVIGVYVVTVVFIIPTEVCVVVYPGVVVLVVNMVEVGLIVLVVGVVVS